MSEPLGFRLDVPLLEEIQHSERRLGGVLERVGEVPDEVGFDADLWPLWQDGPSCTGHFLVRAGYWMTGEQWSPYQPWWWGRVIDGGDPDALLEVGVRTRAMVKAAGKHGMCPWDSYNPQSPGYSRIGPPPAMARMQAQEKLMVVRPIFATGDLLGQRLADSLHRGQACGVVVEVDEAYDRPDGDLVGPLRGPSRGLHIVGCDRARRVAPGRFEVREEGSWGRGRGRKWLHPDRVGAAPAAYYVESIT